MSSVKMSMQDITFKMIVFCLKPLIVFCMISSEVPWNFIAWIYKNLNSKCTPQDQWLDTLPLNSESFLLLYKIQRKMPIFPTMQKISSLLLKREKALWRSYKIWARIRRIHVCILVYVCWVLQISLGVRQYGHQIGIIASSASHCSLPAFLSLETRNTGEQKGILSYWHQEVGSRVCQG